MHLAEEVIAILWPWVEYLEDEPQEYRPLNEQESQVLQLTLIQACEMLRLALTPTEES